ncbi:dna-directed rna polymerases i ii and iii subunit rpabc2 [Holotrichia oblita]|uniref:Dna-directed rna polymerases i ii and iii subunit rpabc2 n=1 Tax=Holotrichia oblita TaxID=644536 RepID=A0ACB9TDS8_HOLOL|nr:dna-directed rna polymerases i ii and iii subunit rpabc2 [Holotrichia oblita]
MIELCNKNNYETNNEELNSINTTDGLNTYTDETRNVIGTHVVPISENCPLIKVDDPHNINTAPVLSDCEDAIPESDLEPIFSSDSSDNFAPVNEEESSPENEEQPPIKLTRWRRADKTRWKRNICKKRRMSGLPYETKKGVHSAKLPRDVNCIPCKYKCSESFDGDFRRRICSEFWKLDCNRQKDYILSCVVSKQPKCKRPRTVHNTNIQVLQHNFMEKCHSYMEVDSMHSAIETAIKYVPVYLMNDWLNIFRMARSSGGRKKVSIPYETQELRYDDFYNLKKLTATFVRNRNHDINGCKVQWLKIKCMRYEKAKPHCILFKYNYSDPHYNISDVFGRGRSCQIPSELQKLYSKQIPISGLKKQSLMKLCNSKAIPVEYHEWDKSLPSDNTRKNTAPEPSMWSDSEDSE